MNLNPKVVSNLAVYFLSFKREFKLGFLQFIMFYVEHKIKLNKQDITNLINANQEIFIIKFIEYLKIKFSDHELKHKYNTLNKYLKLDRYKVKEGSLCKFGAYAEIYTVESSSGKRVVKRLINNEHSTMFEYEIKIMKDVIEMCKAHEIELFSVDILSIPDEYSYIMEYFELDLESLINQNIPIKERISIVKQLINKNVHLNIFIILT